MFSVNNNANATSAIRVLGLTNRALGVTNSHINSGYKVGSAQENASTFGLAQMMRGDIAGIKQVQESISTGLSTVNTAASAGTQISDKLNEIKGKVVQAQEQNVDRALIQTDIARLITEVDALANAASFNGVNMLKAGGTAVTVTSSLNRTSTTAVTAATTTLAAQNMSAAGLAINGLNVNGNFAVTFTPTTTAAIANNNVITFTVGGIQHVFEFVDGTAAATTKATATVTPHTVLVLTTDTVDQKIGKMFTKMAVDSTPFSGVFNQNGTFTVTANATMTATSNTATGLGAGAIGAALGTQLTTIENGINAAKTALGNLGIFQNALQSQGDFVKNLLEQLSNGLSAMVDADLTEESANLSAQQTKQQLGIQAVSIANQQQSAVLSLFK